MCHFVLGRRANLFNVSLMQTINTNAYKRIFTGLTRISAIIFLENVEVLKLNIKMIRIAPLFDRNL